MFSTSTWNGPSLESSAFSSFKQDISSISSRLGCVAGRGVRSGEPHFGPGFIGDFGDAHRLEAHEEFRLDTLVIIRAAKRQASRSVRLEIGSKPGEILVVQGALRRLIARKKR